jgi:tRNA (adenine57-N1/adenine58-N1)-methyltransferase
MLNRENIEFIHQDITNLSLNEKCNFFNLDIPEPWTALETLKKNLKIGGIIISYSPSISQSQKFCIELRKENFLVLNNLEIIERKWVLDEKRSRPAHQGISHTGFLTIARKIE